MISITSLILGSSVDFTFNTTIVIVCFYELLSVSKKFENSFVPISWAQWYKKLLLLHIWFCLFVFSWLSPVKTVDI